MFEVKQKRLLFLFFGIGILVLAQVAWWTTIFVENVDRIAQLQTENTRIQGDGPALQEIETRAERRRIMFWSESTTFALLTLVGLSLLYRALRAEAKSREIERNFIDVVAHESKTPLTGMKLRLEALRDRVPEAREELQLVLDDVRRLSSIFEKAMGLNRVERDVFSPEVVDLESVLSECLRRMDPVFEVKQVERHFVGEKGCLVALDVFQFQAAFQAILENAVLYGGTQVRVDMKGQGSRVQVTVADNGPGIEPKDEPFVFDRFYRGRFGQAKRQPGTGLGLYIVQRVMKNHLGTTRLQTSPSGTEVHLELPMEREEQA